MTKFKDERELLAAVRDRLDGWLYTAREEAYSEVFEGPESILEAGQIELLDKIDPELTRREGRGLRGADEYGIVPTGTLDEESTPHVVSTNHPLIPEYGYPGGETLDEESREQAKVALWEYCERVVEHTQHALEEFVWYAEVETWNE